MTRFRYFHNLDHIAFSLNVFEKTFMLKYGDPGHSF